MTELGRRWCAATGHDQAMRYPRAVRMHQLAATLTLMPLTIAGPPLLDFSSPDVVRTFQVINDGVMGGLSTSRLNPASGSMSFEGEISLENNGGFASFRGPVRFPPDSTVLLLTVRGDGRRYKLTLKLDDDPRTTQYQAAFVAPQEWKTLRFRSADFQASFRGRAIAAPPVRFADARYIGLLISDRQSGPFAIELREIGTEARSATSRR
jgi:monofunctional biosynthetic peptidoglycan transglycosylase